MKCPECQIAMDEVKTSSHYGIPIVIDQCKSCGGLWFDDSEMYRTQHGAAHRINKKLDVDKLRKFSNQKNKEYTCPRDGAKLKVFRDKNFPKTIDIEMCPKCTGFWFNHGGFVLFQEGRASKTKTRKLREESKKEKEIADKLDLQVMNLLKLYEGLEREKKKDKKKGQVETVFYIIWTLLRILLKK